uniref:SMC domain protein n=1 Tax=Heliothis subflexa TaxID=38041 RepID=D8V120_HELSB|nr:SMC domain protein [Heliothis subflexa]
MTNLILWNISKALELKPYMDLKAAKQRLDSDERDLSTMTTNHPEQQHLVCALLAWQQLGHEDADSLYRHEFNVSCADTCISKAKNFEKLLKGGNIHESFKSTNVAQDPAAPKSLNPGTSACGSYGSHTSGPVVKLPVETKLIMRLDNQPTSSRQPPIKIPRSPEKETLNKIEAACCMDSECFERLAVLDASTNELRSRAGKLARRESERVELLERAEAAWKDLEIGYQRRLALAEEKEEDLNKQVCIIQRLIAERNDFKATCNSLALDLKDRGDIVGKARTNLSTVENQVCERALLKMRLSEEAAKGEASLAEHQCRLAQYERDLQFKEDQARRKLSSIQNEADSARALTCEAERAMRAELSGLREQIGQVSKELLQEDELNVRIKEEVNNHEMLRQEKMDIVEDLDGCKVMCDSRMQGRVDELMKKKEMLDSVKEQVMECRCKLPVDATVEAKRTPSLAALCRCAPEDRLLETCSCTSLRSKLLSNLLADLFGGLQAELGGSGSQMPCQLLKCLEDKHNWDRASVIKTNLRNFFSKLLMSELDIAIATSIENYHAKWVGASCADIAKMVPDHDDDLKEGWEQRALEKRAQKMATQLAEQLFQERAEQLAQRAKEIVTSGPPPCECKPQICCERDPPAVFPCLMQSNTPFGPGSLFANRQSGDKTTPAIWKRTIQDVTQLRHQIEDLKKVIENGDSLNTPKDSHNLQGENAKKERLSKTINREESPKTLNPNKLASSKKKALDSNNQKRGSIYEKPTKQSKRQIHGQSYAVNLCLCGIQKNGKSVQNPVINIEGKSSWKQKPLKDIIPQNSVIKHTKPININLPAPEVDDNSSKISDPCNSNCKCFHKVPSNTSIDKLLETLTKWKCDLADPTEKCIRNIKSSFSKYSKTAIKESMRVSNQNDSKINLSISTESNKEEMNGRDIHKYTHNETETKQKSFKQPAATESEYMGAVYLDKSNENFCKCIPNINSNMENDSEKHENGNNNITFKCINTNACECKIYQQMQKDHKRSQTEELYKIEIQSNQCQVIQTNDIPVTNNITTYSSNHISHQKEINELSDINNVTQKTELFPNSCEYYIKFLGVTLDDLGAGNKTKKLMNEDDDVIITEDKNLQHRRRLPKSDTGRNGKSESFKCECTTKFEEFKSLMTSFFNNKLNDNTHSGEGLDSPSFKYTENTIESCVCCNSVNMEDSADLEENTFHLLEDHLKGKLEEFKTFSCKSTCIPPEEEEKLFSAILQRVKQVISDCANEIKCSCPGDPPSNGSWNRAYGLLQEYLKIKIRRVQCLCVLNEKNKDVVLPNILEKVCNLIENDFQRLKDICKCRNTAEVHRKCVRIEDLTLNAKDLPEKDTNNVEVQNFPMVRKLSKQNSNNSMIITENMSSQVPPNLGMEAKSCDVIKPDTRNAQTTEADNILTNSKSNGVMYNKCDCCQNTDKSTFREFSDMFGNKEVLVNLYTDNIIKTKESNVDAEITNNDQTQSENHFAKGENSTNHTTKREINENDKHGPAVNDEAARVPYIGYTVDCTCDKTLGSCVCMKSVVQANNDNIDNLWKGYLVNHDNHQKYSYIMHGTSNANSTDVINCHGLSGEMLNNTPKTSFENLDTYTCENEMNVENEDDLILKYSLDDKNSIHHNMFDGSMSMGTSLTNSEAPFDWFTCSIPLNSERANAYKLANSIYFPEASVDPYKKSPVANIVMDSKTSKEAQNCDCDKVPICHVKMLVENIEKNLIESKCTCDSLISKVCPVHSKRVY